MSSSKARSELTGKKFGKLTVIEFAFTNKHGQAMWKCKCECGAEKTVLGSHLTSGHTVSCGKHARHFKHGQRYTRLYRIWLGMKERCSNPNHTNFNLYGGRGITVCDDWKHSFETFREWAMANGYADGLSIDRIDSNKGYCPDNCRWETNFAQNNNKRSSVMISYAGTTHNLKEWSIISGINYYTLYSRYKAGKPLEEVFAKGVGANATHS